MSITHELAAFCCFYILIDKRLRSAARFAVIELFRVRFCDFFVKFSHLCRVDSNGVCGLDAGQCYVI